MSVRVFKITIKLENQLVQAVRGLNFINSINMMLYDMINLPKSEWPKLDGDRKWRATMST